MARGNQVMLFDTGVEQKNSSTFVANMSLPVHRWFRYSAGFSAQWAESVIRESLSGRTPVRVLDPFAGSATTLLAAEDAGVESYGVESHPLVSRVARAKLARRSDPKAYRDFARTILQSARLRKGSTDGYPPLLHKCYREHVLRSLDALRAACEDQADGSPASELTWLTLVAILRQTSHVGTANWQYILPNKTKKNAEEPFAAFERQLETVFSDMRRCGRPNGPPARLVEGDARTCEGVPDGWATLVITSPPYPNNYDYADATRLEMSFLREIGGWGDLQTAVRQYLIRSCSQHVTERSVDLEKVLESPELTPIQPDVTTVCKELAEVRLTKGGKKTYHLMVACYFLDLARVWKSLRRICASPCRVCYVIGDSAPYGVYVPVMDWLGRLALSAGFSGFDTERIRDRNTKWKNRKHRVPLCEARLWIRG
jgi:hypothetical protein